MTDLIPLAIAAAIVVAVAVGLRLRKRPSAGTKPRAGGSRGRPGAEKH